MHDASIARFAVLTCSSTPGMTGHAQSTCWHRWTNCQSRSTADIATEITTEITTGIAIGFATAIATIVATDRGLSSGWRQRRTGLAEQSAAVTVLHMLPSAPFPPNSTAIAP